MSDRPPAMSSRTGTPLMRNGVPVLVGVCAFRMMWVYYEWSMFGTSRDLDTKTTFMGNSVGWSVPGGNVPGVIEWPSSDNTGRGPEIVYIFAGRTLLDGKWAGQTTIECCAGWYSPAEGSGPARIRVVYNGDTQTKVISPGSQNNAASTHVADITLRADGTFALN